LYWEYTPQNNLYLANNGHGYQVDGDFGSIHLHDGKFQAIQFHFHFPSEHTIFGRLFDGEIHIVHQKEKNPYGPTSGLAIIGIVLNASNKSDDYRVEDHYYVESAGPFFEALGFAGTYHAPLPDETRPIQLPQPVDLGAFKENLNGHYTGYCGSIATPPCTEGVKWFVMSRPAFVSRSIMQHFKAKFPDPMNNRIVQWLNGRTLVPDGMGTCGRLSDYYGSIDWTYQTHAEWHEKYEMCGGKQQSPINLVPPPSLNNTTIADNATLKLEYQALPDRKMSNNGHGLQVDGQFGTFALPRADYEVVQFHLHFPSEHTINGKLFPGELHIVHQKPGSVKNRDLTYVAILLTTVEDDTFMAERHGISFPKPIKTRDFFDNLGFASMLRDVPMDPSQPGALPNASAVTDWLPNPVDLNDFSHVFKGHYAHYHGSVATPPCVETVEWYVMLTPIPVSLGVLQEFKAIFPDGNARPVQPRNGRYVGYDDQVFTTTTTTYWADRKSVDVDAGRINSGMSDPTKLS
jgi:carbonic anhydrase